MSTTTSAATPSLKLVSLEQIHIARGRRTRASASTSAHSRSWPTRSASTAYSSRSSSAHTMAATA